MSRSSPTVAVLTGPFLYEWHARAIDHVQSRTDADVRLVVRCSDTQDSNPRPWEDPGKTDLSDLRRYLEVLSKERAWAVVLTERAIARIAGDEEPLFRRRDPEDVAGLVGATQVECTPVRDGAWTELPDHVVERVRRCDVGVLCGIGLLRGDVLDAPRHGVVSFHPADLRRYRGMGPPVAFYEGRERVGTTLQRLGESIDAGEIVVEDEIDVSDCYTLWEVFDRVLSRQSTMLAEGIDRLTDPEFVPTTLHEAELGDLYYHRERRSLRFSGRILGRNIVGRLRRHLVDDGTVRAAVEDDVELAKADD